MQHLHFDGSLTKRHFGVLIPSTNTTIEPEYSRLLPADLRVHVGRPGKAGNTALQPSLDADGAFQMNPLDTAKAEVVARTSTSRFADDQVSNGASQAPFPIGTDTARPREGTTRAQLAVMMTAPMRLQGSIASPKISHAAQLAKISRA